MPSVPPFSRSEKVADYEGKCKPVVWKEHGVRSIDGTQIKLLEGAFSDAQPEQERQKIVVLYFQGNASSLPPRLPYLSRIMRSVKDQASDRVALTLVALSYRGFWTSSGRATQPGLELDAEAALEWVLQRYGEDHKIIIWGQSIGTGVANLAAARLCRNDPKQFKRISGLLLETPFVNMRALLLGMYPQKWLPYRYLSPFLRSTWESGKALEEIGNRRSGIRMMLLQAGNDEIVPEGQARILEKLCVAKGISVQRQVVSGALHQDIMTKSPGRVKIVDFICSFATESSRQARR
ncbi:Protein bem46 [Cyphellophora attinorum]|uniref:Protein bem46 n=1 Tax=Cyphellophora attinorum TaxID=1664694 RepID=A0A0N0NR14_9EURO|nr:Protein bem46 [Phialophora attinorum]KPI44558.1 Protein bem46 [Phialophora attinorum]